MADPILEILKRPCIWCKRDGLLFLTDPKTQVVLCGWCRNRMTFSVLVKHLHDELYDPASLRRK